MRYLASARINGKEVGRGVAQSKKLAKVLSAMQALQNLSPALYEEWRHKWDRPVLEAAE